MLQIMIDIFTEKNLILWQLFHIKLKFVTLTPDSFYGETEYKIYSNLLTHLLTY